MGVGLAVVTLLNALMQGVFSQTFDVTLPQSIMGISGSCVTVPCRFKVPNNMEATLVNCSDSGVWRRGETFGPTVFTARKPDSSILKGQIVGDVINKNCTTRFDSLTKDHSNTYFFRLDCPNEMKYSFSKGVNITVLPDVSPPRLSSVGQVSEGVQVKLQCSVPVPCSILPPSLTWFPRDESMQEHTQMQENVDGQMTKTSTLTFIASVQHHNQSVSCSVSYPLTEGGSTELSTTTEKLNVSYAPRLTMATLSPSSPVSEGRIVVFTCSSDANPPVSLYTWYRATTSAYAQHWTKVGEGELLVLQVRPTDSGVYLCEAQTQSGSQRSTFVFLEVNTTTGSRRVVAVIPYIICGVMLILYILTVVVNVYKYQRLSRRLKQLEVKGNHTYADLRISSVSSDYDQLQLRQPKKMPSPEVPNYENLQQSVISEINRSQGRPEGTG